MTEGYSMYGRLAANMRKSRVSRLGQPKGVLHEDPRRAGSVEQFNYVWRASKLSFEQYFHGLVLLQVTVYLLC